MKTIIYQMAFLAGVLLVMPGLKAQNRDQEGYQNQVQTLQTKNGLSAELNAYLYPNPSTNLVGVYYNNEGQQEVGITITDVMGNLINEHVYININNGLVSFEYDLSDLPAGDYYVKVFNGAGTKTLKLLKQ